MTVETDIVTEYSPIIAAGIGSLLPQLSARFSAAPVPQQKLERIINSDRDQLVARDQARVVGAATMNVLMGAAKDDEGWLEDFVVDESFRGHAVGSHLWDLMIHWCRQKGLASFSFETEDYRQKAIKFYGQHGAELVKGTTTHYRVPVPPLRGEETSISSVPREVRSAYAILPTARQRRLSGGMINQTRRVDELGKTSILQSLSSVFEKEVISDAKVVADHLATKGWEAPVVLPTRTDEAFHEDAEGQLWRRLAFIESDGVVPGVDQGLFASTAQLLGRWHRDTADVDYQPQFQIPHFHDSEYHAHRLEQNIASTALTDEATLNLAWPLLQHFITIPNLPERPAQIIHGDPKLDNVLFRDGKPFTLIDFDTLMRDSPWLDVGDLLRSLVSRHVRNKTTPTAAEIESFATAYRQGAELDMAPDACRQACLDAGQLIALELGMRFLNDIVDDNYFTWDEQAYDSRRDNHFAKAAEQRMIAQTLQTLK